MTEQLTWKPSISRRGFLQASGAGALGAAASQEANARKNNGLVHPPKRKFADTILRNGKIAPMDGSRKFVEALAIDDDVIIAIGNNGDVQPWKGPETTVIDLEGKTVVPGLIMGHDHPELFLGYLSDTGSEFLPGWKQSFAVGETPEEAAENILETVSNEAANREDGVWVMVITNRAGEYALNTGMVSIDELTEAAPNNPAAVFSMALDETRFNVDPEQAYQGQGTPMRGLLSGVGVS